MQVGQYKARAYTSPTRLNFRSRTVRQVERQRYGLSTTWLSRFFRSPYIENIYHKMNHTLCPPPPTIDTANWTQDSRVLTRYNSQRLHRISIFCHLSLPETPMWISCKRNGNSYQRFYVIVKDLYYQTTCAGSKFLSDCDNRHGYRTDKLLLPRTDVTGFTMSLAFIYYMDVVCSLARGDHNPFLTFIPSLYSLYSRSIF